MKKIITLFSAFICIGSANAQNNINGTFETWHNYTVSGKALEAPLGWYGSDSLIDALSLILSATPQKQVFKSTSSHGGTYAVQLVSADYGGGTIDTIPGALTSGQANVNLTTYATTFTKMPAVNQRIPSMSAWIKYIPVGLDTAYIEIEMFKNGIVGADGLDSAIGFGIMPIPAMSAYTNVTVPITYSSTTIVPDKILVTFSSGYYGDANNPGSTMYIDDAVLNTTTGIVQPLFGQPIVNCFPNPGRGIVSLRTSSTAPLTWSAYGVDGRQVATTTFTKETTISIESQPAGVYLYRVTDAQGGLVQTGSMLLQH
jgi:hypothetical protein